MLLPMDSVSFLPKWGGEIDNNLRHSKQYLPITAIYYYRTLVHQLCSLSIANTYTATSLLFIQRAPLNNAGESRFHLFFGSSPSRRHTQRRRPLSTFVAPKSFATKAHLQVINVTLGAREAARRRITGKLSLSLPPQRVEKETHLRLRGASFLKNAGRETLYGKARDETQLTQRPPVCWAVIRSAH